MNASVGGGGHIPPEPKKTLLERLEELLNDPVARSHLIGFDIVVLRLVIECLEQERIVQGWELRMLGHLHEMMEKRALFWAHRKTLSDSYAALRGPTLDK
jgi:hypothetical protein